MSTVAYEGIPVPGDRLIVGFEPDDEPGLTRVYLDNRSLNRFAVLLDDTAGEMRDRWDRWGTHLYVAVPRTAPVYEERDGRVVQVEGPENDDGLGFERRSS